MECVFAMSLYDLAQPRLQNKVTGSVDVGISLPPKSTTETNHTLLLNKLMSK